MFSYIEPEVAGGIGSKSETHRENGKLVVTRLNYEFIGWLGDAVLESTPCFVASEDARQMIEKAALSGVAFGDVEVTRSGMFDDLYGERELPQFHWMIIKGEPKADDFGIANDLRLVVSKRALDILKCAGVNHAEIEAV
jgi:hypothetical protein